MEGVSYNRNPNGNLYVRYLYWNGDRWNSNFNWLDNNFNSNNPAALLANLFISPLAYCRRSFVLRGLSQSWLKSVHSIHPAFFQSRSLFPRERYIFCRPVILIPKESSKIFSKCRSCERPLGCRAVFLLVAKIRQWRWLRWSPPTKNLLFVLKCICALWAKAGSIDTIVNINLWFYAKGE